MRGGRPGTDDLLHCSNCNAEIQSGKSTGACPNCGAQLTPHVLADEVIEQASIETIRRVMLDPQSQDLLAANLTSSQVKAIIDQLPDTIKSNPKVRMTLPWIRILRLDGKKLVRWSRSSEELKGVFEEVTNNAFITMPEQEIKSLIKNLPPEVKNGMARLLKS